MTNLLAIIILSGIIFGAINSIQFSIFKNQIRRGSPITVSSKEYKCHITSKQIKIDKLNEALQELK